MNIRFRCTSEHNIITAREFLVVFDCHLGPQWDCEEDKGKNQRNQSRCNNFHRNSGSGPINAIKSESGSPGLANSASGGSKLPRIIHGSRYIKSRLNSRYSLAPGFADFSSMP